MILSHYPRQGQPPIEWADNQWGKCVVNNDYSRDPIGFLNNSFGIEHIEGRVGNWFEQNYGRQCLHLCNEFIRELWSGKNIAILNQDFFDRYAAILYQDVIDVLQRSTVEFARVQLATVCP
jgi:hypothetical protein